MRGGRTNRGYDTFTDSCDNRLLTGTTDQADADLKIAQAKAEERRAMAQAREQEMTAQVVEMESRVKEAEAEVPRAMAEAFREGNLGVMDYYRMRNIQADTDMRDSISDSGEDKEN